MARDFSATIICDECGDSQEFILTGDRKGFDELLDLAERSGWECDADDLCANCVSCREFEEDDC
jgi:hypothetical protein